MKEILPGPSNLAEALHLQLQVCPATKKLLSFCQYMLVIRTDAPAQHAFPATEDTLVLWAGDIGVVAVPKEDLF